MSIQTTIEQLYRQNKFVFFSKGFYNLNIFGIRSMETQSNNTFNDLICVVYNTPSGWRAHAFPATTDPGATVLGKKMSTPEGTAILPADKQYKFTIGVHKAKYTALVQAEKFTIVRDTNQDGRILTAKQIKDKAAKGETYTGDFGIHIHRAAEKGVSKIIDDWSWGCQVFQSGFDWSTFMSLIKKSSDTYGLKFTYSLFDEETLLKTGLTISCLYNAIHSANFSNV